MKIQFCGAARTVTGSNFLVDTGKGKLLVDCGLFQGSEDLEKRNYLGFPYDPRDIDWLLLTHAHIDHTGLAPRFCKQGFHGEILATKATVDLCKILLADSGHIHEKEAEWENKKRKRKGLFEITPLYTAEDASLLDKHYVGLNYDEVFELNRYVKVRFRDAGHILGSACIEIWVTDGEREVKLTFSGDIGQKRMPILRDVTLIEDSDVVVMESTYGTRLHEDEETKFALLARTVNQTVDRGGKLIIPAFSVGRTQEVLYYLSLLMKQKAIPTLPVFVDSPLAVSATKIFQQHPECYDEEAKALLAGGENPLNLPGLKLSQTVEESMAINEMKGPAIVISASGMCNAGRIKHHLKHNLPRPESTVLFVGFQAEGTLGRRIRDGAEMVKILDEEIAVKAQITSIGAFSAHADRDGLLEWFSGFKKDPQNVFVVHGDEEVSLKFGKILQDQRRGSKVEVPTMNQSVEIEPSRPSSVRFEQPHPADSMRSRLAVQEVQLQKRIRGVESVLNKLDQELQAWSVEARDADDVVDGFAVVADDTLKMLFGSVEDSLRRLGMAFAKLLSSHPQCDETLQGRALEIYYGTSKKLQETLKRMREDLVSELDSVAESPSSSSSEPLEKETDR